MNFADKIKKDLEEKKPQFSVQRLQEKAEKSSAFITVENGEAVKTGGIPISRKISLFDFLTAGTRVADIVASALRDAGDDDEEALELFRSAMLRYMAVLASELYDVDIDIELYDREEEENDK